jgi:ribosomal-protein-alanine N-acetyltransferase
MVQEEQCIFPVLQTDRLLLTEVLPDDLAFVFEGMSDPVAKPYYGFYYTTLEETKKQLEWYRNNFRSGTGVPWKIVEKSTGLKAGIISFYYYKPEHKKAEVGFWLLPQFWNKGIITEALRAVAQYCKKERGMHRLEAFVEAENGASTKALEKCGFQREGLMRDCEIKFGGYVSLFIYALLLSDPQPNR